jgi:hypothetical protein
VSRSSKRNKHAQKYDHQIPTQMVSRNSGRGMRDAGAAIELCHHQDLCSFFGVLGSVEIPISDNGPPAHFQRYAGGPGMLPPINRTGGGWIMALVATPGRPVALTVQLAPALAPKPTVVPAPEHPHLIALLWHSVESPLARAVA